MTKLLTHLPTPMKRWIRLLGVAAVVGVLSGAATAGLEYGLRKGSSLLIGRFTDLGDAGVLTFRLELLLLPALGGLIAGWLVYLLCPKLRGHGTDLLIRAFHRHGGRLSLRGPAVNAAAAIGVISCGGSAGPEGPVAALGAAIGSSLGRAFSLTPHERRIMLIAGCGAGIGAIFQCPLGGALFATSVLYREPDFETDAIVPAFVASVVGYSTYMLFWGFGSHLLHGATTLVFSSPRELVPFLILGPVCGAVCIVFRAFMRSIERVAARAPRWLAPTIGGLATGAVACVLPQVLDGQYVFIQNAMDGSFLGGLAARSWWTWAGLFGVVAIAKCLATGLTVGSGAPGGVLGPSVFIGGAVGAAVGALIAAVAPDVFSHDPENLRRALIPVGMAGVLSASMRVPLASLVMVTEMTGSYGLIVPLMVVCVSSYLVGGRWGLNDEQVRSSSESPVHAGDVVVHMLEAGRVADVMDTDWSQVIRPDATFGELVSRVEPGTCPTFAVLEGDRLVGCISSLEITHIMDQPGMSEAVIAADIMTDKTPTLRPENDLYVALTLMARHNDLALPVVSPTHGRRFLGMLSRGDIYRHVRHKLERLRKQLRTEHKALSVIEHEDEWHQLVSGVPASQGQRIQRWLVPLQAVGLSLRDAHFRNRFGVQVIAIEQPDGSILCPPPIDRPLETRQRLIGIRDREPAPTST